MIKMDADKVWKVLLAIRILTVFIPQSGYIHPDEFFQTTEVIAGDVLDVKHQETWEFTSAQPIRSVLLPYTLFGPLLYLIGLFNLACPYAVLVLPRLVVAIGGIIVDRSVFNLGKKLNNDGYTSLILYATSYVSWTYMTRTFTNSIEAVLFAMVLALTFETCEDQKSARRRRVYGYSTHDTVLLAAFLTVGTFNRPTFLIFAFVPVVQWLWTVVDVEYKTSTKLQTFIQHITAMSITSIAISLIFIIVDTIAFRYESVRHIPKDLQECIFHDSSKFECLGKMFTTYKPSIVVAPVNFFNYNSQTSNVVKHGSHPWFLHTVVSLPLLFGPAVVFVLWRVLKNILNIILGGSLKVNNDFHLDDVKIVSCFLFPFVAFSFVAHQEPRFLLPLVPAGIVIGTKSMSYFKNKGKLLWQGLFVKIWVFNALALLVCGFLHQGGVVPAIMKLREKVKDVKGQGHVVFYHTYMPPEHLFLHADDSKSDLFVYDLAGASYEKLERTMEKIRANAETVREDYSGIWIVAPKTVAADIKKLSIKFKVFGRFCHLSFEDPPRFMDWFRGNVSWSDLMADFNLVVVEVKSWNIFDSSKKKG